MTRALSWFTLGVLAAAAAPEARAQTYMRTLVPGRTDLCVVWPGRQYLYQLDDALPRRATGEAESAAIEASADAWRAVSATCSDYVLTRGPAVREPKVGYVQGGGDNQNAILFRERDCNEVVPDGEDPCIEADTCGNTYSCWEHGGSVIGLTTTTFSFRTGNIFDADIELNASGAGRGFLFTTVDSPPCEGWEERVDCVATDVQNTVTHEMGHALGLDHVDSVDAPGSTMERTAPPGETHKRVIDVGSAAGFCQSYPRGLPPTQCSGAPPPGHRVLAVAQGPGLACGAAPGALGSVVVLLGLWGRGGRRGARRPGASARVPRD